MSKLEPTVSAAIFSSYIDAAVEMGIDRGELMRCSGLSAESLVDPDGRLPLTAYASIRNVLEQHLGPAFTLRIVETMTEVKATVIAYLMANSKTLKEAYDNLCRYRAIVAEVEPTRLSTVGDRASLACKYAKLHVMMGAALIEGSMGFWLIRGRYITGVDWDPIEVHLQGKVTDTTVYERIFRCKVINGSEETKLVFDSKLLDLPIKNSDKKLLNYLTPIAEEVVKNLPGNQNVKQLVQDKIFNALESGNVTIDGIADQIHMSARTLQRRLEDEGTSFASLLDETRFIAALEYLKDRRISITETAFLLGFSDNSTFYRAFKRWSKQTPAQFRKSL
ncbi:AraC family transcriptional regulator [Saccharophagus degradans]|uniref:AraC family transcriptional regulator n=1 Tax=Saccharophagus degradans TaxID=86304 RepID=UPI002478250F|nr:AraC family transcriptional regulator [Saccharophagus degradans]WGO97864.1 AraC family transcriptional regulator [Saccharophagus degradans]